MTLLEDAARLLGHHEMREVGTSMFGFLAIDLETHTIVESDERACEIFGYEMLDGISIHDLVPDAIRSEHRSLVTGFGKDPRPRHMKDRALMGRRQKGDLVRLVIFLNMGAVRGSQRAVAVIWRQDPQE